MTTTNIKPFSYDDTELAPRCRRAPFFRTPTTQGETMKNDQNQLPSPAEFLASLLADALGSSRSDDGCEGCPGALPVPLLEVPADGDAWIAQPFNPITARVRHIRPLTPEYVREWATKGLLFATREDADRMAEHLIKVAQRGLEVARKRKAAADFCMSDKIAYASPCGHESPTAPPKRKITIAGITFDAPETDELALGAKYWLVQFCTTSASLQRWNDDLYDHRWLANGLIHLDEENAILHLQALRKLNLQLCGMEDAGGPLD